MHPRPGRHLAKEPPARRVFFFSSRRRHTSCGRDWSSDVYSSDLLIERAADVALKERQPLILVVRESPYSEIHLQNMLSLTRMGAVVLPASPGFYHQPQSISDLIDFVVARTLKQLGIQQELMPPWGIH